MKPATGVDWNYDKADSTVIRIQGEGGSMISKSLMKNLLAMIAFRKLDFVDREEVIKWATVLVSDGQTDGILVDLAAVPEWDPLDVDKILDAALRKLSSDRLSEFQAGMLATSAVARQLNQGDLEPIDAARANWRIARLAPEAEPILRTYIGLASEWEDDPENRDLYDDDIRSQALVTGAWTL